MKYNDNGEWKDVQIKVANAIQNEYGESNNDGYSQNYLNDKVVNIGTVVDSRSRVNFLYSNNLFKLPSSQELNQITFTNNGDGTFNISGTASAITDFTVEVPMSNFKNGTYSFSKKSLGYSSQLVFYNGNTWVATPITASKTQLTNTVPITIPSNANRCVLIIRVANGDAINLSNETIMLNMGEVIPFESYISSPSIVVDNDTIYEEVAVQGTCTLGNEYDYDNIAYPDGYNKDNCVVIGCVHKQSDASVWTTGMDTNVELLNGVIGIISRDYPIGATINYKIVLKKI